MADFFVLLSSGEIKFLSLHQDIQAELSRVMRRAGERLVGRDVDLLPFGNGTYKPEEHEAWHIKNLDVPKVLRDAVADPLGCPVAGTRDFLEFQIRWIAASFQAEDSEPGWITFQVLDRRQVITQRGLNLILDRDTFRKMDKPALQVSRDVHAVLVGSQFVFRSLWWARRIFDLSGHYREATAEDLRTFAERPDLLINDKVAFEQACDQWVRTRIGFILQNGTLDSCSPSMIKDRASEFDINVGIRHSERGEQLIVPHDKRELKRLLRFLEEDFYHGPLTDAQYVASGKRLI